MGKKANVRPGKTHIFFSRSNNGKFKKIVLSQRKRKKNDLFKSRVEEAVEDFSFFQHSFQPVDVENELFQANKRDRTGDRQRISEDWRSLKEQFINIITKDSIPLTHLCMDCNKRVVNIHGCTNCYNNEGVYHHSCKEYFTIRHRHLLHMADVWCEKVSVYTISLN